ncbi:MAG: site-specific DNA-methyltransferase [Chloroflexi bacterium]|nr:site-specific DNA-methyltransferase [Chloroflexota bacterium]
MNDRAPRNRTLTCSPRERADYKSRLLDLVAPSSPDRLANRVVNQDFFAAAPYLPQGFVNLLLLDPPYNLSKNYNGNPFKEKAADSYRSWFHRLLELVQPTLAPNASIYVCSDWKTSILIAPLLEENFRVRNRITWEREKGRGAQSNWKSNAEDIWFCTTSDDYVFNVDAVKLKRRVIAPYRDASGKPKDWQEGANGGYRITHPSNIWTDITVPFWSMPENTDHPTQKPEKLIAKLVLASSNPHDFVFDPFLGSGTTAVVCKKLGRRYLGIEQDFEYCCWAEKRLALADKDNEIQGYSAGIFWDRNSLSERRRRRALAQRRK